MSFMEKSEKIRYVQYYDMTRVDKPIWRVDQVVNQTNIFHPPHLSANLLHVKIFVFYPPLPIKRYVVSAKN